MRDPQELNARQSRLLLHPQTLPRQCGPGPQAVWQFSHCPPVPPHWLSTSPCTHTPAEQQPPLQACVPEHDVVHAPVDASHDSPDAQSVGREQPGTHVPPLQVLPLLHANVEPQPPQLLPSFAKSTQVPLQRVDPLLHVNEHPLATHSDVALATLVEQEVEHVPQ
jgi:hypothetical protein